MLQRAALRPIALPESMFNSAYIGVRKAHMRSIVRRKHLSLRKSFNDSPSGDWTASSLQMTICVEFIMYHREYSLTAIDPARHLNVNV